MGAIVLTQKRDFETPLLEYPTALAFLCWIHARKNILKYCSDTINLSKQLSNAIADDISSNGLVYAQNTQDYLKQVEVLKTKMDMLESEEKKECSK
ncbi:MAG: hypothetical protein AAFY76_26855, partial [Cyanobacteria bacterium J06649_11]